MANDVGKLLFPTVDSFAENFRLPNNVGKLLFPPVDSFAENSEIHFCPL